MNICRDCKHSRRGQAIDQRPTPTGPTNRRGAPAPNPTRPGLQGGDFICSREGLTPGPIDSQTGFQPLPSGPDCRDLNPAGECMDYRRGLRSVNPVGIGMVFGFAVLLFAFVVQWVGR